MSIPESDIQFLARVVRDMSNPEAITSKLTYKDVGRLDELVEKGYSHPTLDDRPRDEGVS